MNDLYLQHLFYMRLSEWHSPPSCTCINNSIFCTTQGRTPAHLWVDDADGGFAPDVSLVSLRRRCVEAQDCVVRIWKRKQVLEVMNWPFSAHGPAQNTHTHTHKIQKPIWHHRVWHQFCFASKFFEVLLPPTKGSSSYPGVVRDIFGCLSQPHMNSNWDKQQKKCSRPWCGHRWVSISEATCKK